MPVYYFDVHQDENVVTDNTIGTELKDHAAARREAEQALGEMAQDAVWSSEATDIKISVRDELGQVIAIRSAHFSSEDFDT